MNIEEKIELLENEIVELRGRLQESEDRHKIEMLMGKYHVFHNQKNISKTLQFYALDEPDVFIELGDLGKFVGEKNMRKLFEDDYKTVDYRANMRLHWLCSPMIEIAQDGKTAKGMWALPGAEAIVMEDKTHKAFWSFINYAIDFIKKGDEWKIWHMYVLDIVNCDYEKGWCKDYAKWTYRGEYAGRNKDVPTWNNVYCREYIQEAIPAGPEPYDTFTDDSWIFINEPEMAPKNMKGKSWTEKKN